MLYIKFFFKKEKKKEERNSIKSYKVMNKTDRKAIKSLMCALRPGISYCHPRDFIADSFTLPVLLQIFHWDKLPQLQLQTKICISLKSYVYRS